MKRLSMLLMLGMLLVSCSKTSGDGPEGAVQYLGLRERVSGTISSEGEVDWYCFHAVETNNVLQVSCMGNTMRPDVDLLVTLYQLDSSGNKVPIYGDHAPEGSVNPADLTLNAY
ncbi:hypothetical protein EG829_13285, partial [bacterium]|nr:hypothetical protein [bacterium]